MPDLLLAPVLLLGGIVLVVWGAERSTDGAITAADEELRTRHDGAVVRRSST